MRSLHGADLQTIGVRLVTGHQVVVVENPDLKHRGVDAHAKEENAAEAHHLVETDKTAEDEARAWSFNSYANPFFCARVSV